MKQDGLKVPVITDVVWCPEGCIKSIIVLVNSLKLFLRKLERVTDVRSYDKEIPRVFPFESSLLNLLNYFAASICKSKIQVVIGTGILKFCTAY